MQIQLTPKSLIDQARGKSGQTFGEIATELGRNQTRISEWRSGKAKPEASEIAYFAEKAGLPVLETVAELEAQLRPAYAGIWAKALKEIEQWRKL